MASDAKRREASSPLEGGRRGTFAALLGWGTMAVLEHNGVPSVLAEGLGAAAVPAAIVVGKSMRDFRAAGKGGAIRYVLSWLF